MKKNVKKLLLDVAIDLAQARERYQFCLGFQPDTMEEALDAGNERRAAWAQIGVALDNLDEAYRVYAYDAEPNMEAE